MLELKHTHERINEHSALIGTVHHGRIEHRKTIDPRVLEEYDGACELLTGIVSPREIKDPEGVGLCGWYIRPDGNLVIRQWCPLGYRKCEDCDGRGNNGVRETEREGHPWFKLIICDWCRGTGRLALQVE